MGKKSNTSEDGEKLSDVPLARERIAIKINPYKIFWFSVCIAWEMKKPRQSMKTNVKSVVIKETEVLFDEKCEECRVSREINNNNRI
ncbi:hypothetical protein CEXT_242501 [Caerostris extrusa]|uniref:Uncharacterized protein n=1 Tax=Caerostris extrusa TaxID=172846 RepID=A0AAV4TYK9_CAEEX|nr:hypothetical protein CEXT_242501 [Caerostris extrusa]